VRALSCVIRPLGAAPAPTQCAPTRPVQIDELAASLHGFVGADVTSLCTHAFLAAVCLPPSARARASTRTHAHERARTRKRAHTHTTPTEFCAAPSERGGRGNTEGRATIGRCLKVAVGRTACTQTDFSA
jgi:hypothetical protein